MEWNRVLETPNWNGVLELSTIVPTGDWNTPLFICSIKTPLQFGVCKTPLHLLAHAHIYWPLEALMMGKKYFIQFWELYSTVWISSNILHTSFSKHFQKSDYLQVCFIQNSMCGIMWLSEGLIDYFCLE